MENEVSDWEKNTLSPEAQAARRAVKKGEEEQSRKKWLESIGKVLAKEREELKKEIEEFLSNFYQQPEVKEFDKIAGKAKNNPKLAAEVRNAAEKVLGTIQKLEIRAQELKILDKKFKEGFELAKNSIAKRWLG